jgi:hypothetical protein
MKPTIVMKRIAPLLLFFFSAGVARAQNTQFSGTALPGDAQAPQFSQPGSFTNIQQKVYFMVALTGGSSCSPLTITNLGGSTYKLTDGIASCVNLPTSGVTNAFTNGFGSYLHNSNANNAGQFGFTGAVGYYSQVWCDGGSATNTKCWGANFSVSDSASLPAALIGTEYDVTVNSNSSVGMGNLFSYRGNGQPSNYPVIDVQTAAGTGRFTAGFQCEMGSLAVTGPTLPYNCLNVLPQETGNSQDSSFFWLSAMQGSTAINMGLHLLQDNFATLSGATDPTTVLVTDSANGTTGNAGGFGITLKATSALTVNQLVKIDTANNDSVVVCTTADTTCHGFAAGGSVYCATGGAHCGLITAPGMKAVGILGTGTCSRGNNVIVDTTTNGRIKCQAGVPAQGAWIGVALSAQASVGSTVDILTKFQ